MVREVITVSRRVKLKNLHIVHGDVVDITYKVHRRFKPEPVLPADSSFSVSENGYFFYRTGGKFWGCNLSEQERTLIGAMGTEGSHDGNDAFKVLRMDSWQDSAKMKTIVGNINRKMKKEKVPVKISYEGYRYHFVRQD